MQILDAFVINELYDIAKQLGVPCKKGLKKQEIRELLDKYFQENPNHMMASGTLEVLQDGYGFLRNTSVEKDIYISASQIKRFKLRTEDTILGEVRRPTGEEKNFALKKVLQVNSGNLEAAESRIPFEDLTPAYPTEQFRLETAKESISGRVIDLITPIGRGQRALIIAPPKAGKTMLISSIANSLIQNYPKVEVWILLIDERPEEVTDIRESVIGAEVYASTFDEDPHNHIKVTESILERAKRRVEDGDDIIILMDSLTRLARAYNIVIPSSGKLISGGIDPTALYYPKNFFGTARNIRGGGSLTIIATVLVDTGSKMDDIIYEEFKSTGNCDIHLDRYLSELRIFPSIDIQKSGTRKEELLIPEKKLSKIWKLRRTLAKTDKATSAQTLIRGIKKTADNDSLLSLYVKEGEH